MNKKLLLFACAVMAVGAVPSGFQYWTAEQMREHNHALLSKMDSHKDATETIGSYSNHSIITGHREGNGEAEIHETKVDVMFIQGGEATMVTGGRIPDAKMTAPHEFRGKSIEGGQSRVVHPGDILHIPAKTPHQWLLTPGQKIDYYTVKIAVP